MSQGARSDLTAGASWRARWLYVASALAVIGQHGALIGYRTYANVDEAYAMALASRLMDGQLLYQGAVSQRGPLMYYAYEGIARLVGWDNVFGLRLFALGWVLLVMASVTWAARRTIRGASSLVALGLVAYALAWGIPPLDSIALHGETLQIPVLMLSFVAGALAMRARATTARLGLVCASGLSLGVATCIKQTVLVQALPLVVWLIFRGRRELARTATLIAVYALSIVVIPFAFILHAWQNGSLASFVYYTWTYNTRVHVGGDRTSHSWVSPLMRELIFNRGFPLALLFVTVVAVAWAVRRVRHGGVRALLRGFGVRQYLALHLVISVASASALLRFFPHYFLPATAYLSLAFAASVGALCPQALATRLRTPMSVVAGVYLLYCGIVGAYGNEKIDGRVEEARTVKQVAAYVKAITAPSDRIFVWGFSPWLYGYSGRRPAGRFVFETYVTGFVPWTWGDLPIESKRVVPGSMEQLMGDLARENPRVVVDAGQVMLARSMRAYDLPNRYLHENFCFVLRISGYDVYVRRDGAACADQRFPVIHRPLDFNDNDLDVESPVTKDAEDARLLPQGDPHTPLFFGAPPAACEDARDHWFEAQRVPPAPNPCRAAAEAR